MLACIPSGVVLKGQHKFLQGSDADGCVSGTTSGPFQSVPRVPFHNKRRKKTERVPTNPASYGKLVLQGWWWTGGGG